MNLIYFGFILSSVDNNDRLRSDCNMPVQTHRFSLGLAKSLDRIFNSSTFVITEPYSTFPCNNNMIVKGVTLDIGGKSIKTLGYLNLPFLRKVYLSIRPLFVTSKLFFNRNSQKNIIVIHGLYLPYVVCSLVLKGLLHAKHIVVLTDPVSLKSDSRIIRFFRYVNDLLIRFFLRYSDASFTLSHKLSETYMPQKPHYLYVGEVDKLYSFSANAISNDCRKQLVVTYLGGLEDSYGVRNLVDAFSLLPSTYQLVVCGKGTLEKYCAEMDKSNKNITFKGFLNDSELRDVYERTHLFVNPRLLSMDVVDYTFPSKILDYAKTGIPVVTTKISTIPELIRTSLFLFSGDDVKSFFQFFIEFKSTNAQLRRIGMELNARCRTLLKPEHMLTFIKEL